MISQITGRVWAQMGRLGDNTRTPLSQKISPKKRKYFFRFSPISSNLYNVYKFLEHFGGNFA